MNRKARITSSILALAVASLLASSARAATEPPCGDICGCTTGCARGCTDGGRIITCGVYGDCHTICIHFAAASTGASFLAEATPAVPAAPPASALPWAPACQAAAPVSLPAR
jgi:hypothetical protein